LAVDQQVTVLARSTTHGAIGTAAPWHTAHPSVNTAEARRGQTLLRSI